jgi:hypothetical protein
VFPIFLLIGVNLFVINEKLVPGLYFIEIKNKTDKGSRFFSGELTIFEFKKWSGF